MLHSARIKSTTTRFGDDQEDKIGIVTLDPVFLAARPIGRHSGSDRTHTMRTSMRCNTYLGTALSRLVKPPGPPVVLRM
ncbi:unnamed protein product [Penicillium camemberti]|uniref:Str. FM013 n=1 Tax=Penicillium camemberti (strain FM 013) TaxID=1429867 RepID=A0A0G4PH80_PENC3|nr:unnamed protein product [Penicillium camemberti]